MDEFNAAIENGGFLELNLSCAGIPRLDVMSNSDPFCIVYKNEGGTWRKVLTTETMYDVHTVAWTRKLIVSFDDICSYKFEVYDRDSPRDVIEDHDYVGGVQDFSIADILAAESKEMSFPLKRSSTSKKTYGKFGIAADAIHVRDPKARCEISVGLESKIRSKFYYQISKRLPCGKFAPTYRSELIGKDSVNFPVATSRVSSICGGFLSRELRLELYQFYPMGRSKAMGYVILTYSDLTLCNDGLLPWKKSVLGKTFKVEHRRGSSPDPSVQAFQILLVQDS